MMISLRKTTGRTSTGVLFLQRSGSGYKYRLSLPSLANAGLHVLPAHRDVFSIAADGVYHSDIFDSVEAGTEDLLRFLLKITGQQCSAS